MKLCGGGQGNAQPRVMSEVEGEKRNGDMKKRKGRRGMGITSCVKSPCPALLFITTIQCSKNICW